MALKIGSVLRWDRESSIYILLDDFYVLEESGRIRWINSYYFHYHGEM